MKLDLERLAMKLEHVQDHCAILERIGARPWDSLSQDRLGVLAMDHAVQTAIQAAIDVAMQVALSEGWPVGTTYGNVFRVLASEGVFDHAAGKRLAAAAALRNVIVHEYLDLDEKRLHAGLASGAANLLEFCRAVTAWLDRKPPSDA